MVSFALLLLQPPLQVRDDFVGLWLFHIQLHLLINGRNLSRVTVIQCLAKQARGVLPAPQFDQGTAFSLYFSSLLSSEGKLFIPWAISSEVAIFLVGVSLLSWAAYLKWSQCYCLTALLWKVRQNLVIVERKSFSRSATCRSIKGLLLWLSNCSCYT